MEDRFSHIKMYSYLCENVSLDIFVCQICIFAYFLVSVQTLFTSDQITQS